jgi:hypothetical protein
MEDEERDPRVERLEDLMTESLSILLFCGKGDEDEYMGVAHMRDGEVRVRSGTFAMEVIEKLFEGNP